MNNGVKEGNRRTVQSSAKGDVLRAEMASVVSPCGDKTLKPQKYKCRKTRVQVSATRKCRIQGSVELPHCPASKHEGCAAMIRAKKTILNVLKSLQIIRENTKKDHNPKNNKIV